MADVLISILLEYLGSAAMEKIQQELKLVKGVEKQVEKLSSSLKTIRAVLLDAEKRQVTEVAVRDWLDKLKDVSYDADEVLDEWITLILMSKFEEEEEEGDHDALSEKKVCFFIPSSCFSCTQFHHVGPRRRRNIACKIEELNERLDAIAVEKSSYNFNVTSTNEQPKRQKTSSLVDVSQVYGRDKEKDVIISKLLSESREGGRGFDIVTIVGMGGIGKTTLAQLVYNDKMVQTRFDKRIWLCVSEPFDEVGIAKAIIESLDGRPSELVENESLLQHIKESIKGRRFLLVLDDVWTEDATKWEPLEKALNNNGAVGSRILVTTRKKEVVNMMRAETGMITIEVLSEEVCWAIFSQLAFYNNRDKYEQLEEIGKQISKKCKGVPLVAKTLGSLMRLKEGIQKWKDVLHSELWELPDVQVKVFVPFLLSYEDLSPVEKQCLSYCSIFPKDYEIDRDDLIQLWMSQGYLNRSKNFEKEGRDCFENLAMRSFFQNFDKDYDGNIIRCKMHDIMHDFVQFLTKNECCIMEVDGHYKEKMEHKKEKIRNMTLLLERGANIPSSIYKNKNLRTLLATSSYCSISSIGELVSKLTCVRTLNLSKCKFERLPEKIDNLMHLRYLNLSDNPLLMELPNSLYDLYNLQTLKVNKCPSLEELPEGIQKLTNLRHLYVTWCVKLLYLPKGIEELTCLKTLDMFVVPEYPVLRNKEALKLEDLRSLEQLEGPYLHIAGCGYLLNGAQAKRAQLEAKTHLVDLKLTFNSANVKAHAEILEALQPHPNLKSLKIIGYKGNTINPNWMLTLVNLKRLKLDCCYNCKCLPPLGKLPSLEALYIGDLPEVKNVGREFLGIEIDENGAMKRDQISFQKLELLQIARLHEWCEWEEEETSCVPIMRSLLSLEISWCESLKALPEFLRWTPLQNLTISYCDIVEERRRRNRDWLKISNIPNIKFTQ